jgi:hypothetical protein
MAWCQPEAAKLVATQPADGARSTPPGPETGAAPERLRGCVCVKAPCNC